MTAVPPVPTVTTSMRFLLLRVDKTALALVLLAYLVQSTAVVTRIEAAAIVAGELS